MAEGDSEASITTASWTVAVFSARESAEVLLACLESVLAACVGRQVIVDILVNGNEALASQVSSGRLAALDRPPGCRLRLWSLSLGDKANTWNEYVGHIWPGAQTAFFVDGYVRIRADALHRLQRALSGSPQALAATGVPTAGRSSAALREEMLREGGMHGNLHAMRGTVVQALRSRDIRLPVGLYRTDALIGAILTFGLDPAKFDWDAARIQVEPAATWEYRPLEWWRPTHFMAQYKRMIRQGQGSLENAAVRRHLAVEKKLPEHLPRTVRELVLPWLAAHPDEARRVFRARPLSYLAARRMRAAPAPTTASDRFRLVQELAARVGKPSPVMQPSAVSMP